MDTLTSTRSSSGERRPKTFRYLRMHSKHSLIAKQEESELMTTTLIKNGRIVTAVDDYHADILIEGGTIAMIGEVDRRRGRQGHRREGAAGHPRRHRSAYAHGAAVRRHVGVRRLRDRHASPRRIGGTTTIIDFAVQYKGQSLNAGASTLAREGRRQDVDRLRLSSHLHRSAGRAAAGDEVDDRRGRDELQTVHGLSRASFSSTTPRSSRPWGWPARTAG